MTRRAHIVPTGTANLASVKAALTRAGWTPALVSSPSEVLTARRLVLPGVGTLGSAIDRLKKNRLLDPILQRLDAGTATLAICLGFQLLAQSSEESEDGPGLGILPGRVRRFPSSVRVPQLGWNWVTPTEDQRWLRPGYAYFANSYCLAQDPGAPWLTAWSEHGTRFVAAACRGRVLACQFHPELSGPWGQRLLEWWLEGGVPC